MSCARTRLRCQLHTRAHAWVFNPLSLLLQAPEDLQYIESSDLVWSEGTGAALKAFIRKAIHTAKELGTAKATLPQSTGTQEAAAAHAGDNGAGLASDVLQQALLDIVDRKKQQAWEQIDMAKELGALNLNIFCVEAWATRCLAPTHALSVMNVCSPGMAANERGARVGPRCETAP